MLRPIENTSEKGCVRQMEPLKGQVLQQKVTFRVSVKTLRDFIVH